MNIARTRRQAAALILAATLVHGADAHEVLYLEDGRVYRGEVVDGRPHGEGRMIWSDNRTYEGTWKDGGRHGEGVERFGREARYAGAYRDGERSGHGRFTWPDGRAYEGAWRAGMRHGEGTETLPSGSSRRCTWSWGEVVRESCAPPQ